MKTRDVVLGLGFIALMIAAPILFIVLLFSLPVWVLVLLVLFRP